MYEISEYYSPSDTAAYSGDGGISEAIINTTILTNISFRLIYTSVTPVYLGGNTDFSSTNGSFPWCEVSVIGKYSGASTSKTFVIDHPTKENYHLVHACLEGPETGVYYRGESKLYFDRQVNKYVSIVSLPDYVMKLAKEFTVHVNPVVEFDNEDFEFTQVVASKVKDGKFKVYSNNPCKVNWLVFGKRFDIKVEVHKDEVQVKGQGPYKWI